MGKTWSEYGLKEVVQLKQLMLGNEATARGAYEAGVRVASAYPGAPSTEENKFPLMNDFQAFHNMLKRSNVNAANMLKKG